MVSLQGSTFLQLARSRRSVRRFEPKPVDRNLVLSCIEAALVAPSSSNSQPWRFVVVDRKTDIDRLVDQACGGPYRPTRWIAGAPVVVAIVLARDFVTHHVGRLVQGTPFDLLDAGIAGEHLVLRATELGLGTCWVGWFSARGAARSLGIPRRYRVVALIPLGWPDPDHTPREKTVRAAEEVTWFRRWGAPSGVPSEEQDVSAGPGC
jgi:nitroreductase